MVPVNLVVPSGADIEAVRAGGAYSQEATPGFGVDVLPST